MSFLSKHHVSLDRHPEISLIMEVQNQIQVLNVSLRVVQLHVVHPQVLYVGKLTAYVQISQLKENIMKCQLTFHPRPTQGNYPELIEQFAGRCLCEQFIQFER